MLNRRPNRGRMRAPSPLGGSSLSIGPAPSSHPSPQRGEGGTCGPAFDLTQVGGPRLRCKQELSPRRQMFGTATASLTGVLGLQVLVVAIDIGGTLTDLPGVDERTPSFVQASSLTTPR